MLGNKEHTRFYVSNVNTSSGLIVTSGDANDVLTAGQVAVVDLQNNILADNAAVKAAGRVRLAVKETSDTPIHLSDVIEYTKIVSKQSVASSAPLEKVGVIGYNGTSGSMDDPSTITDYVIHIEELSELKSTGDYPLFKVAAYRSKSTDSSLEVGVGLYKSLIQNFEREKAFEQFIRFEMLTAGTFGTTVGTCTVVNGSKIVSGTGVGTALASAISADASRYIVRIGASNTTSTPSYKATYVSANVIQLDVPYQGVNSTSANTYVASANPTTTGIKLIGVPRKFKEGQFKYQKADWNVILGEAFTTATYSVTQSWSKGVGTTEEARQLEWDLQLNERMPQVLGVPPIVPVQHVTLGNLQYNSTSAGVPLASDNSTSITDGAYDYFNLIWYEQSSDNLIAFDPKSPKKLMVACGTSSTTAADLATIFA